MRRLKILVLQPDFSEYTSAYYQHEFTTTLAGVHDVFRYGPRLQGYDERHSITDVLGTCPFEPDLICFAAGWELEDESVPEYDPHPAIAVRDLAIPSVMVLNKEYKKLGKKFEFIRRNRIRKVFTVHHHFSKWEREVGVPFVHFPFAVNPKTFGGAGTQRRFDLGFSGLLQRRYSNVRSSIRDRLFVSWPIKRPRYWGTRIFWSDGARRLPFVNRRVSEYAKLLASAKMWLSTPSPAGLVGTRYYEIMASKTLLFCSRSDAYDGLFEDGKHCAMFDSDLSDFDEMLFYYLRNDDVRIEIAEAGYSHVLENHTWRRRISQFTDEVCNVL